MSDLGWSPALVITILVLLGMGFVICVLIENRAWRRKYRRHIRINPMFAVGRDAKNRS